MTDTDEYGFFCDLESTKTMEYEQVEYYVVTKRTHWEVRKKPIITAKPNQTNPNNDVEDELPCCFAPFRNQNAKSAAHSSFHEAGESIEKRCKPRGSQPPKKLDTFQSMNREQNNPPNEPNNCFNIHLGFLAKIPRDVYYSFVVCTATISCVYIVMTLPVDPQ